MLDEHFLCHKNPALEYFTDRIIFAQSSEGLAPVGRTCTWEGELRHKLAKSHQK